MLVSEPTVSGEGHPTVTIEGNASEPTAAPDQGPPEAGRGEEALSRRSARRAQVERFVQAVRDSDMAAADEVILRLSRSRRWLAPLALFVGAFAMLFMGVKLLFTNWRLTLIQVLPAMWIWAAMFDLKAHLLHGKTFHVLTGPIVIPLVLAVALITAASFYLNGVFAYAISGTGPPQIRPAFTQAWSHRRIALVSGFLVGVLLGLSTLVVPRHGVYWFGLSPEHRRRDHDDLLRGGAGPAHRHEDLPAETRQAGRHRGGRDSRSGGLHAALSPRPPRTAHARIRAHSSSSASSSSPSG